MRLQPYGLERFVGLKEFLRVEQANSLGDGRVHPQGSGLGILSQDSILQQWQLCSTCGK